MILFSEGEDQTPEKREELLRRQHGDFIWMPWAVMILGLVHIFLVISQPVSVGYWCTLCLLAAAIMLPMIPLAFDEFIANLVYLIKSMRGGKPFWHSFFKGDENKDGAFDLRTPPVAEFAGRPLDILKASLWGMSFPKALFGSVGLGLWLMAMPDVFGMEGGMAGVNQICGALIVTFAVVAMAELARSARLVNLLIAAGIIFSAFIGETDLLFRIHQAAAGTAVALLSLPRGPVRESYGICNRMII